MKQIDISLDDYQDQAWYEFSTNGGFELLYGNGLSDVYENLIFGWITEDYDMSCRSFGLWAGYCDSARGNLSDSCNVPEFVFEALFPTDSVWWNDSESSHSFDVPSHENIAQTMARVANILSAAGFKWNP